MSFISLYDEFVRIYMSIFSSYKKIFLLGFIVVILIAIPFSVYIAQKRQQITSKASQSTTLSFDPSSPIVKVNEILTLDIVLDPGSGTSGNQVSFVKLSIGFDSSKFTTAGASLVPNPSSSNTLTSVLEDTIFESGKASISLSIGADPTRVVTTKTKIAILKLKASSTTDTNNPSSITFDPAPNTQVLSIASSDQTSENVLSTTTPATVTINPASSTSTSSTAPTATPAPSSATVPPPSSAATKTIGGTSQTETVSLSSGSAVFNPVPIFETQPTPIVLEPLPPTGPGEKILGIGIIGIIFTIIGGALFILL